MRRDDNNGVVSKKCVSLSKTDQLLREHASPTLFYLFSKLSYMN